MKKQLATLFLTTVFAAVGSADEAALSLQQPFSANQQKEYKDTIYLKMSVNESEIPKNDDKLMPGLGLGYRYAVGYHAVDVSADANRKDVRDAEGEKVLNYAYTLPRVNYLFYATPNSASSFYAGAGIGFGGVKDTTVTPASTDAEGVAVAAQTTTKEFHGLVPNAVVGYEFGRNSAVKTFVQVDASQPAVAVIQSGDFLGPKLSLSAGVGF